MRFRTVLFGLLSFVAILTTVSHSFAQPARRAQATPEERFRLARDLISTGKFDLAAEQLKAMVLANPTDAEFLAILDRYGPTAFERLRNIPVWSDNPAAHKESLAAVDALIARAREATQKVFRDPARIARFVRNLGATREERAYAEDQLAKAGSAVVPPMVDSLITTQDAELRAGILGAIRRLGIETVPGFLASVEGLRDELKAGVLSALTSRPDVITQATYAETNPLPWLWYYASSPAGQTPFVRAESLTILRRLVGSTAESKPAEELVLLARPFYEKSARFAEFDKNPNSVQVWQWDPASRNVTVVDVPELVAEEYYGLRNLRWAVERDPNNTSARELFVLLAAERSVERNKFGIISRNDPAVYQLLAAAPTETLIRLLEGAIAEKRTAVVFALSQALADRAEPAAATPTEVALPGGKLITKEPVLSRALDYPDPRVQLAAAVGLLRSPGPPLHGRQARVVEVLRRAVSADAPAPGTTDRGRALIGDPSDFRADKLSSFLREFGFTPEREVTGRGVLRRLAQASDIDLIILDRHIAGVELVDVLAQIRNNTNAAGRPVLVVASSDNARPVPFEYLLARLAALIAVTETEPIAVSPPFAFDPRKPPIIDLEETRTKIRDARDQQLFSLYRVRLARLERIVDSVSFPMSPELRKRLDLRMPQLTLAMLAAEYPVTLESAPIVYRELASLTDRIRKQPELVESTERVPTAQLERLTEQLNLALDPPRRTKLDALRRRLDPDRLALPEDSVRDIPLEARLIKQVGGQKNVTVVPEPFSVIGFEDDLVAAFQDPADLPRDPAEKRLAAEIAVEWLYRIAVGRVPGYDAQPAESALRAVMSDPDLGSRAVDAVAEFPTATAQQDLLSTAIAGMLPLPLRTQAADRCVVHIQKFGRLIPANQVAALVNAANAEKDGVLEGKLLVIHGLLTRNDDDLRALILGFPTALPVPEKPTAPQP